MTKESVVEVIERNLPTISNRGITTVEVAFFGGSFTGIPIPQQTEYLSIAKRYKDKGLIHKIRLSTRPDYIDHE
ncbi:MAG: radical SAM protein, partial [Anaerovorax sp.]